MGQILSQGRSTCFPVWRVTTTKRLSCSESTKESTVIWPFLQQFRLKLVATARVTAIVSSGRRTTPGVFLEAFADMSWAQCTWS